MYINRHDACNILGISDCTLNVVIKKEGWKVVKSGTEKLLEKEKVEAYKHYLSTTFSRNQIRKKLQEEGYTISHRKLYIKLRENRRYTLAEVREALGI